ncbi:uncharacterized protein C8Q71DRAFT_799052 [Rhodofomes roseus]|uniref:Mitochondrial zinc maintenance protein 1, mitochondrial n=1 Tax=Rhodofomes roseus TaxID=34475 RepID=A0ABQ8K3V7_9APHY|nr:uncharacterized protein C8Q71DRAFT_799052 [Rhodofomes roseus]KAH9831130.1 hypothetical protein C8Q71DRAFT_799052 [Rhodofomes roseus]
MVLAALHPWSQNATREARRLILSVLQSQKEPVGIHDLLKLVVEQEAQKSRASPSNADQQTLPTSSNTPEPPYPTHVIRSMKYLRSIVLPDLMRTKDVRRVYIQKELTPEEIEQRKRTVKGHRKQDTLASTTHGVWRFEFRNRPVLPKPKEEVILGEEVGVGADWSHLNRRRGRSRVLSVVRDVRWLKKLEKAREEALGESNETATVASS